MRVVVFLAGLLALPGCAAVPPAAWGAIGAIAGAVSQTEQLDILIIDTWLSMRGLKSAPKETACPIPK